jgi:hypothetical protein
MAGLQLDNVYHGFLRVLSVSSQVVLLSGRMVALIPRLQSSDFVIRGDTAINWDADGIGN